MELMEKTRAFAKIKGLNVAPPQPSTAPTGASFSSGGTKVDTSAAAPMHAREVPANQTRGTKGSYGSLILIVVAVVGLGAAGAFYLDWRKQTREE